MLWAASLFLRARSRCAPRSPAPGVEPHLLHGDRIEAVSRKSRCGSRRRPLTICFCIGTNVPRNSKL